MRAPDRELVRSVQKAHGLSAAEVADVIGVTPRTVRRWLDGTRTMGEPVRKLLRWYLDHPTTQPRGHKR